MARLRGTQAALWTHEDLPLWSGTPPTAQGSEYLTQQQAVAEHSGEQTTWATCPVCLDTLILAGGPCPCTCFKGREQ